MSRVVVTDDIAAHGEGSQCMRQRCWVRPAEPDVAEEPSLPAVIRVLRIQQVVRDLSKIYCRTLSIGQLHGCIATIFAVLPSMIALNRCAHRSSACRFSASYA